MRKGGGGGICSDQFLKQIRENDILSVYSSHFTAKFSPKRVEIIDMVNDEKKNSGKISSFTTNCNYAK